MWEGEWGGGESVYPVPRVPGPQPAWGSTLSACSTPNSPTPQRVLLKLLGSNRLLLELVIHTPRSSFLFPTNYSSCVFFPLEKCFLKKNISPSQW
jgi:hypothetical protein